MGPLKNIIANFRCRFLEVAWGRWWKWLNQGIDMVKIFNKSSYVRQMGVWQGVANGHGLPKISLGPPCSIPLRPAGGPPLKLPYGCFKGFVCLFV
jgi:hypothetical protein